MTNWLFITIGSIVGSLILSIVGNLLTNPIEKLLSKYSSKRAKKQLAKLREELSEIQELKEKESYLYLRLAEEGVAALKWLTHAGAASSIGLILFSLGVKSNDTTRGYKLIFGCLLFLIGYMCFRACTMRTGEMIEIINAVKDFEKHNEDMQLKIVSLEKRVQNLSSNNE